MATNKERPQKEEPYKYEDRKLIILLLSEYSKKLLDICELINKKQSKLDFILALFLCLVFVISLVVEEIWIVYTGSVNKESILFILLSIVLAIFFKLYTNNLPKLRQLQRDSDTICVKLEKLIRVASQVQEHVIHSFICRIELDFRIADAESAIKHYKISKKNRSVIEIFYLFFIFWIK